MNRLSVLPIMLAIPALTIAAPCLAKQTPRTHKGTRSPAPGSIAAVNRSGTAEPSGAAFINASAILPFVEGTIYHIYTAPERVTDIALEPGEALTSVASGDTARWVIGDTSSGSVSGKIVHVLVKPFATGLATNLVITTDRRTYHVALTSSGGAAMSAISWSYPMDALLAIKRRQEQSLAAEPVAAGLDVDELHFGYQISGDQPAWRPLRAFDDGRQTFIEFPASLTVGEAPPLFIVGAKGEAELVNYRLSGRYYVVDRIFETAELRLGTKRQAIVRISRAADKMRRGGARRPA
ncbi:MAG: P-type conjugative transfer protein TrbG [Sphingomonas sp.]